MTTSPAWSPHSLLASAKDRCSKRLLFPLALLGFQVVSPSTALHAQSLDDLNLQLHGFATQSFVYTDKNNWNSLSSTNGSSAWTEAVVNVIATPDPRVRVGIQARYFLLGNDGNRIDLDWASADVKLNERFGFRVGKVKSPLGLFNDTQDIDPSYLWTLLPESIYPLSSRNSSLAHYGAVVYGSRPLGEKFGKLDYKGFAGERILAPTDGFLEGLRDSGFVLPDGLHGRVYGATAIWHTPVRGFLVGASVQSQGVSGTLLAGPAAGQLVSPPFTQPRYFSQYEHGRWMLAAEYTRQAPRGVFTFPGAPPAGGGFDQRAFYVMATARVRPRLNTGLYYSSSLDRSTDVSSARFRKDWVLATRYDFNPFLYLKAEQHFIDGTELAFSNADNPQGLQPNTRMTMFKLGVSF